MWVSLNVRATDCFIKELEGKFPTHGLMDNLEVGCGVPKVRTGCS
jgi:hypothetical protein